MFVRNGEKLGSVVVDADPSDAEPQRPRKAAAKKAAAKTAEPKTSTSEQGTDVDDQPEQESEPPAAPEKPEPATAEKPEPQKSTGGFKSALDKKG